MTHGTHELESLATGYVFVSCDIVGHSGETDLELQQERVAAINRLVRDAIASSAGDLVWASGGDGGHVAFAGEGLVRDALDLIVSLRRWSAEAGVPLRVVASYGEAMRVTGADGRPQLVGHGINFAGGLLRHGHAQTVLASRRFREVVEAAAVEGVRFHDEAVLVLPFFGAQEVWALSVAGAFESLASVPTASDDRAALQAALGRHDSSLEPLYRAKRLLQVHPNDRSASEALLKLADRRDVLAGSGEIAALILDPDFGSDFIRGAQLLERRQGDLICRSGDEGTTMFLVLRGELGGVAQPELTDSVELMRPEFRFTGGALVGELAFALKRPRTATIWCLQDAALLAFDYNELVSSSPDPEVRTQLEEAINRTIRPRIVEHVGRTLPYIAGGGGPLEDADATWNQLRRFSRLVSLRWKEHPLLEPGVDPVRREGLYILIRGMLESTASGRRLRGADQPLVYVDVPGQIAWRDDEYALFDDDVMLLAIQAEFLMAFGPSIYRELVANLRKELGLAGGVGQEPKLAAERREDTQEPPREGRRRVFIGYSHKDRIWLDRLRTHLEPSLRESKLDVWDDTMIRPGTKWRKEIEDALAAAGVAVLLVSPTFLESEFIAEQELPPLLQAAEKGGLQILWIPISYSRYDETRIADYQAAHSPDKPLASLGRAARDKAFVEICKEIDKAARGATAN
jgi:CRP-like cAMP-binding protein